MLSHPALQLAALDLALVCDEDPAGCRQGCLGMHRVPMLGVKRQCSVCAHQHENPPPTRPTQESDCPLSKKLALQIWLTEHNIVDSLFDKTTSHSQLKQRSTEVGSPTTTNKQTHHTAATPALTTSVLPPSTDFEVPTRLRRAHRGPPGLDLAITCSGPGLGGGWH